MRTTESIIKSPRRARSTGAAGIKTVAYTYDVDGNRASLTDPEGIATTYTHTARNQIAVITADGPPPLATFAYDAAGNRTSRVLENGTTTSYAYDNGSRLLSIAHANGSGAFASAAYAYDAVNRRTSETRQSGVVDGYGYDAADQVTSVSYGGAGNATFAYDPAGNRTSTSEPGVGAKSYSANALNQYTAVTGVAAPTYDANGNMTAYGPSSYLYDGAGRLTTVSQPSLETTFHRDSRNRVARRAVDGGPIAWQIYDGWNLIAEYDASGSLKQRYVHGTVGDEILLKTDASDTVYYHANGLGSTVVLSDDSGDVIERVTYTVWGVPRFTDGAGSPTAATAYGNRFLFTGREYYADLEIYDYRNRAYSAELGRFWQTDPIRFEAGDVNLYRYVSNNPVNWVDPMGLVPKRNRNPKPPPIPITTRGARFGAPTRSC